jgi:DNA-binding SARP family transcriptional activator
VIPTGAERLRLAAEHPEASPLLSLVARVLAATADLLAGRGDPPGLDALADEADALGWPWIARLAHGVRALSGWPERLDDAARARAACREHGDEWGDAVLGLAEGLGRIRAGTPDPRPLVASAATFARLGATTLEAWARAGEVLALALTGGASTRALARAEAAVRASEADGPLALLVAARELLGERPARPAAAIAGECGLALPVGPPAPPGSRAPETPPPVRVRCFGGLAVERDGSPVDLSAVKPRARAVLQVLAVHGGAPVHREVLLDALWPDADVATGVRNLQVAISTLRHVLDTAGGQSLIQRDGDSYRLALPAGAIDVCAFEAALAEARGAEGAAAVAALDRALALYAGELLPEAGPAEWVLKARESCRMQAAEAAQRLATVLADAGDLGGARTACRRGLEIDRYRDGLWQALIAVLERAGEPAAAASARREYRRVLAELGIDHGLGAGSSGPPGEAGRP